MGILVGQVARVTVGGTSPATTSGVVTQSTGSTFLAIVACYHSSLTPILGSAPVSDNKGNTGWALQGTKTLIFGGVVEIGVYAQVNGAGGAGHTCTVTATQSENVGIWFIEVKGGLTSGIIDQIGDWIARTGVANFTALSNSITTTQAAELVLGIEFDGRSGTGVNNTYNNGFIVDQEENDSAGYTSSVSHKILSSTSTEQLSVQNANSTECYLFIISFKELTAVGLPGGIRAQVSRRIAG